MLKLRKLKPIDRRARCLKRLTFKSKKPRMTNSRGSLRHSLTLRKKRMIRKRLPKQHLSRPN